MDRKTEKSIFKKLTLNAILSLETNVPESNSMLRPHWYLATCFGVLRDLRSIEDVCGAQKPALHNCLTTMLVPPLALIG